MKEINSLIIKNPQRTEMPPLESPLENYFDIFGFFLVVKHLFNI